MSKNNIKTLFELRFNYYYLYIVLPGIFIILLEKTKYYL